MRLADEFILRMENLRQFLREELKWSQTIITDQLNKKRLPAPAFKVGDIIILNLRNIKTERPNKSLDHKNLGLYKVTRVINNIAYGLELPNGINIYPVFHLWLLHLDNSDPLPGQMQELLLLTHADQEGSDYFVNKVVDSRIDLRRVDPITGKKGYLIYRFKWTGYTSPGKWEPY